MTMHAQSRRTHQVVTTQQPGLLAINVFAIGADDGEDRPDGAKHRDSAIAQGQLLVY